MRITERRSPCIGVCSATALGDLICRGCFRSRTSVEKWIELNENQRKAVTLLSKTRAKYYEKTIVQTD